VKSIEPVSENAVSGTVRDGRRDGRPDGHPDSLVAERRRASWELVRGEDGIVRDERLLGFVRPSHPRSSAQPSQQGCSLELLWLP
jgi:hypothetical protein